MEQTGDMIPWRRPGSLEQFLEFARSLNADSPAEFLGPDERRTSPQGRDPFEEWDEA